MRVNSQRGGVGGWALRVGSYRARVCAIALACIALTACRQDMHDAPSYDPLQQSAFFTDGAASRMLVANTVARGQLREDELLYNGQGHGQPSTEFPMPVTADVLTRGRSAQTCTAPLSRADRHGNGMIVQRGFRAPPSYHDERCATCRLDTSST